MGMQIKLDDHHRREKYYPGQTIQGKVIFELLKQHTLQRATIVFRGKVETEYGENRRGVAGNTHGARKRVTEYIQLFSFGHTLFQGPYDVSPQTFEWPFTFNIPESCEHTRVGNESPGFIPDGICSLPPSFAFDDARSTHDARARVKYKLCADIEVGGLFNNESQEFPISICRTSRSPPTAPQLATHEYLPTQCWSSRSLRLESHTLKQKLHHLMSNDPESKIPCVSFRSYVHFPTQLAPQQRTSVAFSIKHYCTTPVDPEFPTLILESLRLTLNSFTTMTVSCYQRMFSDDQFADGKTYVADHVVRFKPVELNLKGEEACLSDDICLAQWKRNTHANWIGDFDTYTIKHRYKIKAEAVVRHKESGHVFQMKTEFDITLLDPFVGNEAELEGRGRAAVLTSPEIRGRSDSELPPYDGDVRPPAVDGPSNLKS